MFYLEAFLNEIVEDESNEYEFTAHDDVIADTDISEQFDGSELL